MGDFFGHCLPGTFFILVGMWWLVNVYTSYFNSKRENGAPYVTSLTFPVRCLRRCSHIDALVLVVICGAGILVELVGAPLVRTHGEVPMALVQHATMYYFFGQFAVVLLVTSRKTSSETSQMGFKTQDLQYVTFAMAQAVEGLLFMFHLYGRDPADVLVHTLLLYAIFVGAACSLLELVYRDNLLLALARIFCILLQGTWFWQVAFFLHNPFRHDDDVMRYANDDMDNGETLMLMACAFAWHMGGITLFMLLSGALLASRCKSSCAGSPNTTKEEPPHALKATPLAAESDGLLENDSGDEF